MMIFPLPQRSPTLLLRSKFSNESFHLFSFLSPFSFKFTQKFVQGLSILSRGTLEEKLCWTFQLYDINSDGHITKEEMNDIVTAIYNLMGHPVEEKIDEERIKAKVDRIFDVSLK
jgi:Ca2+-binding EF-hand superfamily protein